MIKLNPGIDFKNPLYWFCFGWCVVLLVPIFRVMPYLQTFIHPWRAEFTASILFLITLLFLIYENWNSPQKLDLSRSEVKFIILPMLVFIAWSGLSIAWSPSWKSALYHTLIWIEYLIFYVIARQILQEKKGLSFFSIPLLLAVLIICLPPVVEYLTFLVFGGATSLGIRYGKYGELINTISPIFIVGILRLEGKRFIAGILTVLAMWLFIISTLGRTNLLLFLSGTVIIAGITFIFKRFHVYRTKMAIVVLAIILVPVPFHLITFFNEEPNVPIVKRIGDDSGISYSTDVRKLIKSVSLEMFKTHPLIGVGADNFGMRFNNYRVLYAEKNPGDLNLLTAENETAERSHNEYLQVLAELGIVGGVIFLCFLLGIGGILLKHLSNIQTISLQTIAAILGIGFFLASSAISSFSFRIVQNGFVFFFVLAIAAGFLSSASENENTDFQIVWSPLKSRFAYSAGIFACMMLAILCLVRVSSVYFSYQAQLQPEIEQGLPYYQTSFWLDDENPTAHYALAMQLFTKQRYKEAIPQLKQSIRENRASSVDYSYLASAQSLAGDNAGAEDTIAEAVRLYPLSTFVQTRYAALLKANGKIDEADEHLKTAFKINEKEARTWLTMMTEGARAASIDAAQNNYTTVMKLSPLPAVYAIVTEREILHPEEKFRIPSVE